MPFVSFSAFFHVRCGNDQDRLPSPVVFSILWCPPARTLSPLHEERFRRVGTLVAELIPSSIFDVQSLIFQGSLDGSALCARPIFDLLSPISDLRSPTRYVPSVSAFSEAGEDAHPTSQGRRPSYGRFLAFQLFSVSAFSSYTSAARAAGP